MKRSTWDLTILSAAVCSAFIATPADALTPLTPHPISAKYSDIGSKPASGRSGSAGIEARALKGANGATDIEVTTGHFEGLGAPGTLAKVQVKLLAPDGFVLATDNYRKTLTGNGYASFTYDALPHGMTTQVQASVTGIDPNRTDIVTVSTPVMLRPDIQATRLVAPATAILNTPVLVSASMSELNRDVGARATCRLLVDGIEVAAIPGAWIDAGSSVACDFQTSFASAGTHELKLRVTDVAPSDFDVSNNEVTRSIDVLQPAESFDVMTAYVREIDYVFREHEEITFTRDDGVVSAAILDLDRAQHTQEYGALAWFTGIPNLDGAQITFRNSTSNGNVMPTTSMNVADLKWNGYCYLGYFGREVALTADLFAVCTGSNDYTSVQTRHTTGVVIYAVNRLTTSGPEGYIWYGEGWDLPSVSSVPGRVVLGETYTADLRFEAAGVAHQGVVEVPVREITYAYAFDNWDTPDCSSWWEGNGTSTDCYQMRYSHIIVEGGKRF